MGMTLWGIERTWWQEVLWALGLEGRFGIPRVEPTQITIRRKT